MNRSTFFVSLHYSVFLKLLPCLVLHEPSLKYPELFNSISIHPVPSATVSATSATYFSPDENPHFSSVPPQSFIRMM